jgi:hypothetical protein
MNILEAWFRKAVNELLDGEALYLEVEDKYEQSSKRKNLLKLREAFEQIDVIEASKIEVFGEFKFKKFWVGIRKRMSSPLIGLKKSRDGKTRRIYLSGDLSRERRIKLMISDGMGLKEIEEIEGPLKDDEKALFI